jgi:phosphohistidine phosphatase
MKYLTVLRHAKSSWDHPGLADHDRPLNERGVLAAPAVTRFLMKTYFGGEGNAPLMEPPQAITSSTAQRAFSTAQFALSAFGLPPEALRLDSRLYLASPGNVLEVVRGTEEKLSHLVIVGHNPGLHDFCNEMLARASIPRLPTCSAVVIGLPHAYWGMADWQEAQLIVYVTPKALELRFPAEYAGISTLGGEGD